MDRFAGLPALLGDRRLISTVRATVTVAVLSLGLTSSASAAPRPMVSSSCSATADSLAGTGPSGQLITVIATTSRATTASLTLYQRVGTCWRATAGPYDAFVGYNGLSSHKHEGDDTTPIGLFALQSTMYGINPNPGVSFSYHRLVCGDWWDEDSRSALYNHFVHVQCGTTPHFGGDSEALWETVPQYEYFAVISYNHSPVVRGRGSAIFLHVSKGIPTTGCVSLPVTDLLHVLRALLPSEHPLIDISTRQLIGH